MIGNEWLCDVVGSWECGCGTDTKHRVFSFHCQNNTLIPNANIHLMRPSLSVWKIVCCSHMLFQCLAYLMLTPRGLAIRPHPCTTTFSYCFRNIRIRLFRKHNMVGIPSCDTASIYVCCFVGQPSAGGVRVWLHNWVELCPAIVFSAPG